MKELAMNPTDEELGEKLDQQHYSDLWQRWKVTEGVNAELDPERFIEMARNVPPGDLTQMAKVTVSYALERTGLLLTPEQLSEPLTRLGSSDELERARITNRFLEYTALADQVWEKVEEASDKASQYTFDQLRSDLPVRIPDAENLAAMKVIKSMLKSRDDAFERVGNLTKSHGAAILRIMYAWEQGIKLPKPGKNIDSVS